MSRGQTTLSLLAGKQRVTEVWAPGAGALRLSTNACGRGSLALSRCGFLAPSHRPKDRRAWKEGGASFAQFMQRGVG